MSPPDITAHFTGDAVELAWPQDRLGRRGEGNAVNLLDSNAWFTLADEATTNRVLLNADHPEGNVFFRLVFP